MGIYRIDDYKCEDCGHEEELLLDKEEIPECPQCKSKNVKRLLSVGVHNGSHFSWAKWRV